jgi:hypothetical protein
MRVYNVSVLVVALAAFAAAEDQPNKGVSEQAPVKTVTSAVNEHAFVNNQEVVVLQGQKRFVIPMKSITEVSYTAVNSVSISIGPSPLTEASSAPLMVKTKDHYVGIVWMDKSEPSGVVLKVGMAEFEGFMTVLEAAGIKPIDADELRITKL